MRKGAGCPSLDGVDGDPDGPDDDYNPSLGGAGNGLVLNEGYVLRVHRG